MATQPTNKPALRAQSWRVFLAARPRRNSAVIIEDQGNGTFRFTVPLARPKWFIPPISWLLHPRWQRVVELNGIGARVWEWCDDYQTLEEIIDHVAHEYQLTFHEARASVLTFLKLLVAKGLIAIEQPVSK